jgi:isopropylmalate/homocitrate/citramalate synthase
LSNLLSDVRCDMRDAKLAVETGVDGLDVVIGTSSFLREHSHGKDMAYITKTALEVIEYIKSKGLEVRCKLMNLSLLPNQNRTYNLQSLALPVLLNFVAAIASRNAT